jgi:hypothetical protein
MEQAMVAKRWFRRSLLSSAERAWLQIAIVCLAFQKKQPRKESKSLLRRNPDKTL